MIKQALIKYWVRHKNPDAKGEYFSRYILPFFPPSLPKTKIPLTKQTNKKKKSSTGKYKKGIRITLVVVHK